MTTKPSLDWMNIPCGYCNDTGRMTNPGPDDDMGERCYYCDACFKELDDTPNLAPHQNTPASTQASSPAALNPLPLTTLQTPPPNAWQPPAYQSPPPPSTLLPMPPLEPLPPVPGAEVLQFETIALYRMVCKPVTNVATTFGLFLSAAKEIKDAYYLAYKDLVKDKILQAGFPEHLWPTDETVAEQWVLEVAEKGYIPSELRLTTFNHPLLALQQTSQERKFHPRVEQAWARDSAYRRYATYVFTNGEAWWEGNPTHFLAGDTDTTLLAYLYARAANAKTGMERDELLNYGAPKRRGRPKDEAAAKLKEEEAQRARDAREAKRNGREAEKQKSADAHWAWVEACRKYRIEVEQARAEFQQNSREAREEMKRELEAARVAIQHKYQQTLIQLETTLLNLEKQGAPLRGSE